jgi:hypothetical protein
VSISGCSATQDQIVRVTEVHCEKYEPDGEKCAQKRKRGSTLAFTINPTSNSVALSISENAGDWQVGSKIYRNCAVVNSDNWECSTGGENIGLYDGSYHRQNSYYRIDGLTGRYYWHDVIGFNKMDSAFKK